jgi:hypothetical protein
MAVKGTQFECIAGRWSNGEISVEQGFTVKLHPDDPRMTVFANNPAFKATPCYVEDYMGTGDDDGARASGEAVFDPGSTDASSVESNVGAPDDSVKELPDIPDEIIAKMIEAGYDTVGAAFDADIDGLTEIHGIGDATANKIMAACRAYLGK